MRAGDPVGDPRPGAAGCCNNSDALTRLVGEAPSFQRAIANLPQIAKSGANVLVTGETGTGKELVARTLHAMSLRSESPFIAVNCGLLSDALLEDELFGHERGAFTDARASRPGYLLQAEGGTLLLDEVDTLPYRAQVALLRILEDGRFRPLGSDSERQIDLRFIAATNAPIATLQRGRRFRIDLYHRLAVFTITLPALRERREDIILLAQHFLTQLKLGDPLPQLAREAESALVAYHWPGNVRELKNVVTRGTTLAGARQVEVADLGLQRAESNSPGSNINGLSFKEWKRRMVEEQEHGYLVRLMKEHYGNVTRAAESVELDRRDLRRLLQRHRIEPRDYRADAKGGGGVFPQGVG